MPWISDDDDGMAGAQSWGSRQWAWTTEGEGRLPSVASKVLWVGLGRAIPDGMLWPARCFSVCVFFGLLTLLCPNHVSFFVCFILYK